MADLGKLRIRHQHMGWQKQSLLRNGRHLFGTQGRLCNASLNSVLLQEACQGFAIRHLDVHEPGNPIGILCREYSQLLASRKLFRIQILQRPQALPTFINLAELCQSNDCLNVRELEIDSKPVLDLTTAFATTKVLDLANGVRQGGIAGDQKAALTGCNNLRRAQRKAPDVSLGSLMRSIQPATQRLCGILNESNFLGAAPLGNLCKSPRAIVQGHMDHGTGLRSHGCLNALQIHSLGLRVHIHKDRGGSNQPNRISSGNHGLVRDHHFIPRLNSQRHKCRHNRAGATGNHKARRNPNHGCQLSLQLLGLFVLGQEGVPLRKLLSTCGGFQVIKARASLQNGRLLSKPLLHDLGRILAKHALVLATHQDLDRHAIAIAGIGGRNGLRNLAHVIRHRNDTEVKRNPRKGLLILLVGMNALVSVKLQNLARIQVDALGVIGTRNGLNKQPIGSDHPCDGKQKVALAQRMATHVVRVTVRRNGAISYLLNSNAGKTLLDQCRFLGKELAMNLANHLALRILEVRLSLDPRLKLLVQIRFDILEIRDPPFTERTVVFGLILQSFQIRDSLQLFQQRAEGVILLVDRMAPPCPHRCEHFCYSTPSFSHPNEAVGTTELPGAQTDWLPRRVPPSHCRPG